MIAPTTVACTACGHPDHRVLVACPGLTGTPCGCTTTQTTTPADEETSA